MTCELTFLWLSPHDCILYQFLLSKNCFFFDLHECIVSTQRYLCRRSFSFQRKWNWTAWDIWWNVEALGVEHFICLRWLSSTPKWMFHIGWSQCDQMWSTGWMWSLCDQRLFANRKTSLLKCDPKGRKMITFVITCDHSLSHKMSPNSKLKIIIHVRSMVWHNKWQY